jgi:hypothetical protein
MDRIRGRMPALEVGLLLNTRYPNSAGECPQGPNVEVRLTAANARLIEGVTSYSSCKQLLSNVRLSLLKHASPCYTCATWDATCAVELVFHFSPSKKTA